MKYYSNNFIAYFLAAKLLIGFGIDCGLVKAMGVLDIA
jgi:hypothetical protein